MLQVENASIDTYWWMLRYRDHGSVDF